MVLNSAGSTKWAHRTGLAQVRWAFLLFALALSVVSLPGLVLLAPGAGWAWRAGHAVAVAWLVSRWLTEYRQGLSAVGWDVLDGAALLLLCLPGGAFPAVGLFYGACYWRAVSSAPPRAVGAVLTYGVLFTVVVFFEPVPPQTVVGPVLGLVASSLLILLVVATMSRHEVALRREREFLNAVLENLDAGVVACDAQGEVTVVNDAARNLHSIPVETTPAAEAATRYGLYAPDGVTPLKPEEVPMTRALRGERVRNQQVVMVSSVGQRTVMANARPLPDDENGRRLGAVLALHDVTGIKHAEQALVHQSLHDALTGLPNRALLADRFDRALRTSWRAGTATGLLLIDLDRFKEINDTLGHHYGDAVLTQIGPRLAGAIREADTVARLGGDEFVVLLPEVEGVQAALNVAEKLREALQAPFQVDGIDLNVEASVGVVVSGEHGADSGLLLQRADIAMYLAKGRSLGVAAYDPAADEHSPQRLALLGELRRAMNRHELVLHYQPKISLSTGDVVGVEALVRWQHPTRGLIAPDAFVPLAEHTGLIGPLTRYVLDHVLTQARAWMDAGRPMPIAVNLSARNLLDDRLAEHVAELLSTHQVPARLLELEVTETAIITEPARAQQLLHRLSELGVRLAIDDFGAGYTSLGQLKNLPVTELKIDRSFVTSMTRDRGNALIVASVVELGHNLGLTAVAEGVETAETMTALGGCGCDVAQGRYLSSPLPAATFDTWYTTTHQDQDRGQTSSRRRPAYPRRPYTEGTRPTTHRPQT